MNSNTIVLNHIKLLNGLHYYEPHALTPAVAQNIIAKNSIVVDTTGVKPYDRNATMYLCDANHQITSKLDEWMYNTALERQYTLSEIMPKYDAAYNKILSRTKNPLVVISVGKNKYMCYNSIVDDIEKAQIFIRSNVAYVAADIARMKQLKDSTTIKNIKQVRYIKLVQVNIVPVKK